MSDGEGVALAEIEALYRARLGAFRRVARGILGDDEAARDAVQEAFAGAVRNREAFRGEGAFEGWVWRMVVNAARMRRRAEAARPVARMLGEELAANGRAQPDAQLRAAVSALPERQRLVLLLHYYAARSAAKVVRAVATARRPRSDRCCS